MPSNLTSAIVVYTKRYDDTFLINTTLEIDKKVNNTWVTIAQKRTDVTGGAEFFLIPDTLYKIYASQTGYSTIVRDYQATETPVYMYLTQISSQITDTARNVKLNSTAIPNIIEPTYQVFTATITSTANDLYQYGLMTVINGVTYINKTTSGDVGFSASGGTRTLYLDLTGNPYATFYVKPFFSKSTGANLSQSKLVFVTPYAIQRSNASVNNTLAEARNSLTIGGQLLLWLILMLGVFIFVSLDVGIPRYGLALVAVAFIVIGMAVEFIPLYVGVLSLIVLVGGYLMSQKTIEGF